MYITPNNLNIMFTITLDLQDNEEILLTRPANHFLGIEGVGGKIFITNKRFVFKSHELNIQKHQLDINYTDIDKLIFFNTLLLFPNGLKLILKNGKEEKFAVWKRQLVKGLILNNIMKGKELRLYLFLKKYLETLLLS